MSVIGVEFQLREIVKAVPKETQPDIKNLKSISEVWDVLSREYGRPDELVTECTSSLVNFQFTAKSDRSKFVELYKKWTEVIADLEEIGELKVLNHVATVESVVSPTIKKLPGTECKSRYANFILSPGNQDK